MEVVVARICREGGARPRFVAGSRRCRRLEVVVEGLSLFGGAQLAMDMGLPLAHTPGAALKAARRRKERTYPELAGGSLSSQVRSEDGGLPSHRWLSTGSAGIVEGQRGGRVAEKAAEIQVDLTEVQTILGTPEAQREILKRCIVPAENYQGATQHSDPHERGPYAHLKTDLRKKPRNISDAESRGKLRIVFSKKDTATLFSLSEVWCLPAQVINTDSSLEFGKNL